MADITGQPFEGVVECTPTGDTIYPNITIAEMNEEYMIAHQAPAPVYPPIVIAPPDQDQSAHTNLTYTTYTVGSAAIELTGELTITYDALDGGPQISIQANGPDLGGGVNLVGERGAFLHLNSVANGETLAITPATLRNATITVSVWKQMTDSYSGVRLSFAQRPA